MYRRELILLLATATLAFIMTIGGAAVLVNQLNSRLLALTAGTIPDLDNGSHFIARQLDNWTRLLLIEESTSKQEQNRLIDSIRNNSTSQILEEFKKTPSTAEQAECIKKLEEAKDNFFVERELYFKVVQGNNPQQATQIRKEKLIPLFQVYRGQADKLVQLNSRIGQDMAQKAAAGIQSSVISICVLAAISFLVGVLVGFRVLYRSLALAGFWGITSTHVH